MCLPVFVFSFPIMVVIFAINFFQINEGLGAVLVYQRDISFVVHCQSPRLNNLNLKKLRATNYLAINSLAKGIKIQCTTKGLRVSNKSVHLFLFVFDGETCKTEYPCEHHGCEKRYQRADNRKRHMEKCPHRAPTQHNA
jgi:hypothetical protein